MPKEPFEKWTTILVPLLTLIVGTFLGSGFLWEAKKHDLDAIVQTTDLRKQENDLYAKIIDLSNEYIKAQAKYSKTPSNDLRTRIVQQNSQLEMMKDDFTALETKLAHLEGRAPRTIILQFWPPSSPTGLGLTDIR